MLQTNFDNYNIAGDLGVIATCAIIVILLMASYVSRNRSFRMFTNIIVSLVIAAVVNIVYHCFLAQSDLGFRPVIYVMRIVYQALLLDIMFLFALYTTEVSGLEHKKSRVVAIASSTLMTVVLIVDIIRSVTGYGFSISDDGTVHDSNEIYIIGYIAFAVLLAALLARVRRLVYKRIIWGFYGVMAVSVLLRFGQYFVGTSSLTTMAFVFPTIAMLYVIHANPYSVTLGALDPRIMESMVRGMYQKKQDFAFMSLLLPDYDAEGKEMPEELRYLIRKYSVEYFRNCALFQLGNGHVVLLIPKDSNPDCEKTIDTLLEIFGKYYQRFRRPYKVVVGNSIDEISRKNEYASLVNSVERSIPENTIRKVGPDDVARFNMDEYILRELTDIYKKRDVDDPRVLAYCQPVFNLKTGRFDTAEALMRLDLEDTGIIEPARFIPLAERYEYIHVLTEIILNKTCREVKRLIDDGYNINRVSVNVSVIELKDDDFCRDIDRIIEGNGVPGEKIALELTESGSEADFMIMKAKIEELRGQGIKFYLDDFGTGYSNMQRIMELPFDIIKFDRSLVVASGAGERSERIVENLAHLFKDMDYSILYEGVESSGDEERCREMSASYLQGYRYSRPVPIEKLREFLQKAV